MRTDSAHADGAVVLARRPRLPAPATSRCPGPRRCGRGCTLPRPRVALGPLAGRLALASLVLGALALVAFATSGPTVLVPRSNEVFPAWEAGPLHALFSGLPQQPG